MSAAVPAFAAEKAVTDIAPYVYPKNSISYPAHFTYMPDGTQYAMLSDDHRRIETFDIKTGNQTGTLVDLGHVREQQMPDMSGFIISPKGDRVILYRDVEYIYRRSFKAEYYVYEVRTRILDRMSPDFDKVQIPTWSPDGSMIAFVHDNDIYLKKLNYNNQVRVTTDGEAGKIINGATDWTYEEEFTLTNAMAWAPDNLTLCYVKFNETRVPLYSLPIYEGACNPREQYALYPGSLSYKYPVAGQPNSVVTLHSYDIDNRKIKDIPLPDSKIEYIARIDYGPTPEQLMVSTLNRDQNHFEIYSVNPKSTVGKSVFVEESKAWIPTETYENITYTNDGFVVMSARTGFMHLYKYLYNGTLQRTLTSGDYDVTAYYGADAKGTHFYQAALPSPIERTVYSLNVKNVATRISADHGTSSASFSPGRNYMRLSYSDARTPTRTSLCSSLGKELRMLEDNSEAAGRFSSLLLPKEFIKIPSDGNELNAYIIRPRNFDPSKKYPVVMTQYSGPGSQSVLDSWSMDWEYFFANSGFIVACVDGRGTGGRGSAFMTAVYKDLGHYETIDQINAAKYISTLPGVDPSRIGICGWSYGGYETLMCATQPGTPFAAAVAIAPVTDWRYYDTVYTERYMLTPQQNEQGYAVSSPVKRAARLGSRLLVMYGTADDNVHPVNSLEFVSALEMNNMFCDMLLFPNMNHSINGCNSRAVVYAKMFDFFKRNL